MESTIRNENELREYAENFAKTLELPATLLLRGDVGAGKTTFTRYLAAALGVDEPVTSPSFTISKSYSLKHGRLVHYDFYRLDEPGIMREDLAESTTAPDTLSVIEWGQDVEDLLPDSTITFTFIINEDGSRLIRRQEGK